MTAEALRDVSRLRLLGILSGTWTAQACYVLAKLGLPDRLADGPRTAAELAGGCGADPGVLRRLLTSLAAAGLLRQPTPGTFALAPITELLRSDVSGSVRGTAILYGEEVFQSFAGIMHTVHTGQPAFDRAFGMPFYDYLDEHEQAAETFHAAMGGERVPSVFFRTDLRTAKSLVDLGGGSGGLLAAALDRYPDLRGTLVELPAAARQARESLAGLGDRVTVVEGSLIDSVPAHGDVYVLCRVLHNWSDEQAADILRRVHRSMPGGCRLVVVEGFLTSARTHMVDLLMLVMLEGRDRTAAEYRDLLTEAGFAVLSTFDGGDDCVEGAIEAVRA